MYIYFYANVIQREQIFEQLWEWVERNFSVASMRLFLKIITSMRRIGKEILLCIFRLLLNSFSFFFTPL